MKNFIPFAIVILFTTTTYGQLLQEYAKNEMKYWKLRGRLTGDINNRDVYNGFLVVGSSAGMSIPFSRRLKEAPRGYHSYFDITDNCYEAVINSVRIGNTNTNIYDSRDGSLLRGILATSDNPLIDLGVYLQVLSLEWSLAKRDGGNTWETEKEMYYALKAIDRLDDKGKSLYGLPNSKNGLILILRC